MKVTEYNAGWHEIRNTASQPKNKQTRGAHDKLSGTNLKKQLTSSNSTNTTGIEGKGKYEKQ